MRTNAVAVSSNLTLVLAVTVPVSSLADARAKVATFVSQHGVSPADYGDDMGRVFLDGTPYARVSIHGKLWALDPTGKEMFREMSDAGRVAP